VSKSRSIRRDRFLRVATRRTNQAIAAVRYLARCSSRVAYEFSPAESEKICKALEAEVRDLRAAFGRLSHRRSLAEFSFEDDESDKPGGAG